MQCARVPVVPCARKCSLLRVADEGERAGKRGAEAFDFEALVVHGPFFTRRRLHSSKSCSMPASSVMNLGGKEKERSDNERVSLQTWLREERRHRVEHARREAYKQDGDVTRGAR